MLTMTNTEKAVYLRVFHRQEGTASMLTSAVKNTNYWFRWYSHLEMIGVTACIRIGYSMEWVTGGRGVSSKGEEGGHQKIVTVKYTEENQCK